MEASSETLKENHHYLKAAIYYEVLRKKPIFKSYRNFCKTVGRDAMEYPDFEFWYYRFYHGSRDFDYDRSADPKPKTLVDIPVVVMKKIAEYLDPVERTRLRSMNHTIKAVADFFPPLFEKIEISIFNRSLFWTLNDKMFVCTKERNGCSLRKPNCALEKSEKCHIKKSLEYLAPLLKMPNIQVNHFSLSLLCDETLTPNDLLSVPFNAKNVLIHVENVNQVVQFLSAMTPGHLESFCIDTMENHRAIFETDQFKQAKSVKLKSVWGLNVGDLTNFSHLKRFKCNLRGENVIEDVPRIRDRVSTFEAFESCELSFCTIPNRFAMRGFADALGEEIPIGPLKEGEHLTITHRYRIPDSNASLEFKIEEKGEEYRCIVKIIKVR
ncbi:hypothetical protein B9Z55_026936 [Caenorhabditis nigoni]|uniref:F-box domain-containing protein n=1 Tax=Caenorhabditis nigoni TaxID=1611254 RepID=A0A2G5SI44_9PELO|nr:hypothetical protein B9Z55_026936 [Caenorhabditis nigoni]